MRAFITALLLTLLGFCQAARTNYTGYQVWQISISDPEDVDFLLDQQSSGVVDIAGSISRSGSATISVAPKFVHLLTGQFLKRGIAWSVQIEELQKLVDAERQRYEVHHKASLQSYDPQDFNTLEDNYNHMADYVASCSSRALHCTVESAGDSYEGRPINIYKISTGGHKPIIWIDATIHAREWLATTTAVRIFDHLIEQYGNDEEVTNILDNYDFWILPIGNPDGYDYSWTNTRLFRKNRRPQEGGCIGVDLNRNFDFRWCRQGISTNPCEDVYCGPSPASELETRAYQNAIAVIADRITTLITLHTFGEMWMHPWGNTKNYKRYTPCVRAEDHDDMYAAAKSAAAGVFESSGRRWAYGTSCDVIYAATGTTDDWAKGVAGVKYAFNPELRGSYFIVPQSEIEPSFQEVWSGMVNLVQTIEGIEGPKFPLNRKC